MKTFVYFLVLSGTIIVVNGRLGRTDYCNLKSCSSPRSHSLCRFSPDSTGPDCGTVKSIGITNAEIREVVDKHNEFRAYVARGLEKRGRPGSQPAARNLGPLKWNAELATIAQAWANQCQRYPKNAHDDCHDTLEYPDAGQSMAYKGYSDAYRTTLSELVSQWYNEVKDVNRQEVKYYTGESLHPTGHYTQLIWANTTDVGCGVVRFSHKVTTKGYYGTLLICNYGPGGNVRGEPIYQAA